jgi:hypothetical protein
MFHVGVAQDQNPLAVLAEDRFSALKTGHCWGDLALKVLVNRDHFFVCHCGVWTESNELQNCRGTALLVEASDLKYRMPPDTSDCKCRAKVVS